MFCSKCGKELTDDIKFCPECGHPVNNNQDENLSEDIKNSINETQKKKPSGCLIAIIILFILFIFLLLISSGGDNSTSTSSKSSSCPSVLDMEDAINQYKSVDIITKFAPELNTVYISSTAQNVMNVDSMQTLGYLTACYSAHVKGNDLVWVDIYNYNTGKRIAKYSKTYGFKMY